MLDFRIETFLTVCDTMNYREAARLLHITQPAVTQHIQHLEQEYHCKLFLYENRRLTKTREAQLLETYAHVMKANEQDLRRRIHGSEITELKIGATKTIGDYVIGPYAEHFIAREQNKLTLIVDNTRHLLHLLDKNQLDFALVEGYFDKTAYGFSLFRKEPFVGICAPDHPFANRQVSISELLEQTMICREEGSGTRSVLESKLLDFNESIDHFKRSICISSFPLILDFVRKGYGISFVYEVLAKQGNLGQFWIKHCPIEREFNFVYLKHTGAEEKIQKFMESTGTAEKVWPADKRDERSPKRHFHDLRIETQRNL